MCDDVGEGLVSGEERGSGEGEARVLHAAVGEAAGWQFNRTSLG